jgi:short-subunit dehydrogenase
MELREKTFLITGASSGIGAATAREAATRGAHVILVARSQAKLERLAEEIRKTGGNASSYVADLSEPAMIRAVTDTIKAVNGTPDIIMNNAGSGIWKYAHETTPEEAAAMVTLPYLAAFGVTHAFLPGLIERGSGTIVNLTSAAAFMAWPGATAYSAARWAMRGFNDALRTELTPYSVNVMLAAFARVNSDYWRNNPGSDAHIPARQAMIPELSPELAARHIISGIEHEQRQVIEPWQLRAIITLAKFFPDMVASQKPARRHDRITT